MSEYEKSSLFMQTEEAGDRLERMPRSLVSLSRGAGGLRLLFLRLCDHKVAEKGFRSQSCGKGFVPTDFLGSFGHGSGQGHRQGA